MIATEIPEKLGLTGTICLDEGTAKSRLAPAAGTVVGVSVTPGTVATRGDIILSVTGEAYITAQRTLIHALTGQERPKATLEQRGAEFNRLYGALRALKFTSKQIDAIRDAETVIDPLPILAPVDGVVTDVLDVGRAFSTDESLFRLATGKQVLLALEATHARYLRPFKRAAVRTERGDEAEGVLRAVNETDLPEMRQVCLELPQCSFHVGEPVTVIFKFAPWERLDPNFTSKDWPYPNLPRSQTELDRFRGLHRPLSSVPAHQLSLAQKAKLANSKVTPANPFSEPQSRPSRPKRSPGNYLDPRLVKAPTSNRYALPLDYARFTEWKFSTFRLTQEAITPQWSLPAQVVEQNAAGIKDIAASADGTFHPEARRRNDIIRAGTVVGFIENDKFDRTAQLSPPPSTTIPASQPPHDEARLGQIPIYADCDGVVMEMLDRKQHVSCGDPVMKVRCSNMYLLRTRLLASEFIKLPRIVEARLFWPERTRKEPIYVNSRALITQIEPAKDQVTFDVTFPTEAGHFKTGHFKNLLLLDNSAQRIGLTVPKDCIAKVGCSTEMLIHSETGKLTPSVVKCGPTFGESIEIVDGLTAGHFAVRDLEALCAEQPDIRAIMGGFWNPRP
jgi:hypothetical protein